MIEPNRYLLAIVSAILVITIFSGADAFSFQDSVVVEGFPRDIGFDPVLNNLYVPNYDFGNVSIIDSNNMVVKDIISLDNQNSHPARVVVDSTNHRVFVSDKISGKLTVIDGRLGEVIKSIKIGESLWDLDVNESTNKLYVSDLLQNKIFVIDTTSMNVIKTISISSDPWSVVVNQKTNTVYVASGTSKIIHVIDGETDEIVQKLEPDYKPWGLSINEGSDVLYVTSWESSFIDVIDLKNNLKMAEIPITSGAWQMDTDQFSGITAVLNEHSNELYLLDDNSKHFKTITLYDSSQSVVISPLADKVFLTNPLSGSVSSIALKYEHSEMDSIIENIISDNDSRNDELILDVLKGLSDAPNRHDVDSDLISGLLQNVGITGDVNGNEIARLLIEDYNEKKEKEPKSVAVPFWTIELASMFADETQYQIPDNVDCMDDSFSPIHDYENVNPFEIWINILPICALS